MTTLEIGIILFVFSIGIISLRKPGDKILSSKDEFWDSWFLPFEFILLISIYLIWVGWII